MGRLPKPIPLTISLTAVEQGQDSTPDVPISHTRAAEPSTVRRQVEKRRANFNPSAKLTDIGDRRRARLLSGILFTLVAFGALSGVVQLALIPGFLPTFTAMSVALSLLFGGYLLSRTEHFRIGALVGICVVILACAGLFGSTQETSSKEPNREPNTADAG